MLKELKQLQGVSKETCGKQPREPCNGSALLSRYWNRLAYSGDPFNADRTAKSVLVPATVKGT
jgi:hypothetical protein